MKAEQMRETMEVAHEKEIELIDRKAEAAKDASEEMHAAKMRAFDRAVTAVRGASRAAGAKATMVSGALSKKATDLGEAAGMKASDLGAKAGEIKTKTTQKAQNMPWLAPMAAVVLLLALGLSVAKRMRAPASFDI